MEPVETPPSQAQTQQRATPKASRLELLKIDQRKRLREELESEQITVKEKGNMYTLCVVIVVQELRFQWCRLVSPFLRTCQNILH